jgi:hypothetical protein
MKTKTLFFALTLSALILACTQPKPEVVEAPADVTPPPAEFADPRFAEIGKQGLNALASGDIDSFVSDFAENAVYRWNAGDSVVGKQAIHAYWKDRRTNAIDKIVYADDIWLPIKINQPQKGPDVPGVWLLSWFRATITYKKSGKTITQWIHTDYHFDSSDKIDIVVMYLDRAPINAAVSGK